MESPNNRMADTAKRTPGRPPLAVVERNPPIPAEEVYIPVRGYVCPGCGRAMQPRVVDTRPLKRTMQCTLCPARFTVTYDATGRPMELRKTS